MCPQAFGVGWVCHHHSTPCMASLRIFSIKTALATLSHCHMSKLGFFAQGLSIGCCTMLHKRFWVFLGMVPDLVIVVTWQPQPPSPVQKNQNTTFYWEPGHGRQVNSLPHNVHDQTFLVLYQAAVPSRGLSELEKVKQTSSEFTTQAPMSLSFCQPSHPSRI